MLCALLVDCLYKFAFFCASFLRPSLPPPFMSAWPQLNFTTAIFIACSPYLFLLLLLYILCAGSLPLSLHVFLYAVLWRFFFRKFKAFVCPQMNLAIHTHTHKATHTYRLDSCMNAFKKPNESFVNHYYLRLNINTYRISFMCTHSQ